MGAEGRVHTTWDQTGASTGRVATRDPNLQNLPNSALEVEDEHGDKIAINIRSAFKAREGFEFVGADYSQIEMKVLAHVTQDKELKAFFAEKRDIHTLIASKALGNVIVESLSSTLLTSKSCPRKTD